MRKVRNWRWFLTPTAGEEVEVSLHLFDTSELQQVG